MPSDTGGAPRAISRKGVHPKVVEILRSAEFPRGRLLDAGGGQGALALKLRDLGYEPSACDANADGFKADGIPFRQADLNGALPYPDASFDYVTCTEVIEHLQNPFNALRECARVLRPDGVLVLSTPNYMNIEMRLRFLLNGSLSTPKLTEEHLRTFRGGIAAPHIMPMTWWVLRFGLEAAGFRVRRIERNLPKRKQLLLWPLAALIRLVGRLNRRARREKWLLDATLSGPVLLGGNVLIVVAQKAQENARNG